MNKSIILDLYRSSQTVFSLKEISLLYPEFSYNNLKSRISYYVSVGKLRRVRKGIFAKLEYNRLELANKIYTPSYISLETVLAKEGIIFQQYQTIFVISYLTRKIKVDRQEIFYRKLKNEILMNNSGVEEENGYYTAIKERAFLDAVFLYRDYHFDNLKPLDWEKVSQVQKIYQSQTLVKRVNDYYKIYKQEYA